MLMKRCKTLKCLEESLELNLHMALKEIEVNEVIEMIEEMIEGMIEEMIEGIETEMIDETEEVLTKRELIVLFAIKQGIGLLIVLRELDKVSKKEHALFVEVPDIR